MEFTQLENTNPVITPVIESKIYNKLWIDMLTLTSPTPHHLTLYCKMIPCRDTELGKELKSNLVDDDVKVIRIENLWEVIETNPKFVMAMELIFQSVKEYGVLQGILKDKIENTDEDTDLESSSSEESSESSESSESYIESSSSISSIIDAIEPIELITEG